MKRIVLLLAAALFIAVGDSIGQTNTGTYNKKGGEALENGKYAEAFGWFQKSAEAGDAYGQYQLAFCYRNGEGVDANEEQAIRWFRASANGECQYAYNPLGRMLERDNPSEAFSWYKKSADTGDMVGQYNLAMCYINGVGTDYNDAEAKALVEKSAAQGYSYAKEKLRSINDKEYWNKKPLVDFIGLPSVASVSSLKIDIGAKADNGRITKTVIFVNNEKIPKGKGLEVVKDDEYDIRWNKEIALREGTNIIRIEVTNRAGTATKEQNVTYRPARKATINWVAFPSTVNTDKYQLKAEISSQTPVKYVSLTVNGQPINVTLRGNDNLKYIDESLLFIQGNNTVGLSVTNDVGTIYEEQKVNYIKLEKRLALVIGNSNYKDGWEELRCCVKDAKDMEAKLRTLGFDVITEVDADGPSMERGTQEFLMKAPNYDVALFYYSGHGMQHENLNYLIPIGVKTNSIKDLKYKCISANSVLDNLESKAKIVILDACRTHPPKDWIPTKGLSNSKGLSSMSAEGTYIAYATGPGKEAIDGPIDSFEQNSPYTETILEFIDTPNLKLEDLFKKVRIEVKRKTHGTQVPWATSNFEGDFYFKKN